MDLHCCIALHFIESLYSFRQVDLNIITNSGAGAGGREADLMMALQLLLDRLNSGQIPMSQTMYEQLRKDGGVAGGAANTTSSSDTTNINFTGPMVRHQISQ